MGITVVGLGPGDPGDISRAAWDCMAGAGRVWLRTERHPARASLPAGPEYHSFDGLYEQHESFEQVYAAIVESLIGAARAGEAVVYAVPGDPTVAESSVAALRERCKAQAIPFRLLHGVSFIEPSLGLLGLDAVQGLQIFDALEIAAMHHPPINPDLPALVCQVYGQHVASELKLTLMNQYPDEHPVALLRGAGTREGYVEYLPLYEIDRRPLDHLVTLYLSPIPAPQGVGVSFEGLQETMAHLRAPEGCPWDREQDHITLKRYLIEEAHEFIDAVDEGDIEAMRDELGDLLLQVVFHAQVATEEGEFQMADVIRSIDAKLKRRHPHVWGSVDVGGDPGKVLVNWEAIKAEERAEKGIAPEERGLLDGVPKSLPALAQAHEYDRKARKVGFDWPDVAGVVAKVEEEIREIHEAQTTEERFQEIGDLLLVIAVWARWLDVNPEEALRAANRKFYRRFSYAEKAARARGIGLNELSAEALDALWNEAKRAEKEKGSL